MKIKIVGITGAAGSGKSEIASYLQEKEFVLFSVRDFLTNELKRREADFVSSKDSRDTPSKNRGRLIDLGNELRKMHGSSYIIEELYALAEKEAKKSGRSAVIESIRAIGEVDFLKKKGAVLMAVEADPRLRFERIKARKSSLDHVSYEKFISDENREMDSADPNKQNIRQCVHQANFVIQNDGTLEELHEQIEKVLHEF